MAKTLGELKAEMISAVGELGGIDFSKFHDKRKAEGEKEEEVLIQPKRMCQSVPADATVPKKTPYPKKKTVKRLGKKEKDHAHSCSSLTTDEDDELVKILQDIQPAEIERLRQNLEDGNLDRHFSWAFWNYLHDTYSSYVGYGLAFLLVFLMNRWWIWEELADESEGHSVSKVFVALFLIFSYSFVTLGLEIMQTVFLIAQIYFPNFCTQLWEEWRELHEFIRDNERLNRIRKSKYFFTPFAVSWCLLSAFVGSKVWVWFWWNHICKSYHDRLCRGSWLGELVIAYRDEACYDGTASSIICERFVSYLPIMIFCMIVVFIGNVIFPVLNDWLSLHYPISKKLESAFDIMERINNRNEKEAASEKDEECTSGQFTFSKDFDFAEAENSGANAFNGTGIGASYVEEVDMDNNEIEVTEDEAKEEKSMMLDKTSM